jgi:hypothetical protein
MHICRFLELLFFVTHTTTQAQDVFESLLNDYATSAIEYAQSKEAQIFIAEDARSSCQQPVDMIEMILTAVMAQPILAEVETVVVERRAQ